MNQVTKHAETPQIQHIDKVVDAPVGMQRQVPQIQTVLETMASPMVQSVGRVVEAPAIMQMRQCRMSRRRTRLSETQEVLAGLVEDKIRLQSKATKKADLRGAEGVGRKEVERSLGTRTEKKHILIRCQSERERARKLQRLRGSRSRQHVRWIMLAFHGM